MNNRHQYPQDWQDRARICKEQAGWKCAQCCVEQYTVIVPSMEALKVVVDSEIHHPKMIHLHAAHVNHDTSNPEAELRCLCASCHGRYDHRHRTREARVALERLRHQLSLLSQQSLARWSQKRRAA